MSRAETLQQLSRLCRNGRDVAALPVEPSGYARVDSSLPGGGWPVGTIVELMSATTGIGELRLLLPTLARLTRAERHVAIIAPPYVPFAPALAQRGVRLERLVVIEARTPEDSLWAFEQALRCKSFGAALAWTSTAKDREIRRLQLAAESARSIGFLYRSPAAALESSPAAVRLKLRPDEQGLSIDVLKCRGGRSGFTISIDAQHSAAASSVAG